MIKKTKAPMALRKGATPKTPLAITITVEAACWQCPEAEQASAVLTYQDSTCNVSDDADKEVGSVAGGMGGHVVLRDKGTRTTYAIRPDDLWHAFQSALKRQGEEIER